MTAPRIQTWLLNDGKAGHFNQTRAVVMAQGRIVADGPTRELLADEELLEQASQQVGLIGLLLQSRVAGLQLAHGLRGAADDE